MMKEFIGWEDLIVVKVFKVGVLILLELEVLKSFSMVIMGFFVYYFYR